MESRSQDAGVAEYGSKVLSEKPKNKHLPGKIAKLLDSLAPELLQLLTPEFPILLGRLGFREVPEFRSRRMDPALLVCEGSPSNPKNESTSPGVEQQKSNRKHRNS
jgi:hypothetical protein